MAVVVAPFLSLSILAMIEDNTNAPMTGFLAQFLGEDLLYPPQGRHIPFWYTHTVKACGYLLLLLLGQFGSAPAFAADPDLRWRELQTPHFRIYYHQRTYRFALRAARIAEEAHTLLVPYAAHKPKEITHIVIYDNTDSANGSATVLPRNVINLLTAPPAERDSLNDSDDWLRVLIYHEYLHILHMDTMSGIHPIVNTLIGKTFAPNALMPRWWLEGWAVFVETHFTGGGRNHSSYTDMFLRTAVLNKLMPSLSRVSNGTYRFPQGTTAYLYGAFFIDYIAKTYGKDKLTELSHRHGSSLIPYDLNIQLKNAVKKNYAQLWKEWKRHLRQRYGKWAKQIKRHPLTPSRALTHKGERIASPRYSADGKKILLYRNDGRQLPHMEWLDRKTLRRKRFFLSNGSAHFGMSRHTDAGVLSQIKIHRGLYYYNDLFWFSPKTGVHKRLTHGLRAHQPDISSDGTLITYVKMVAGGSSLWTYNLKHKKHTKLYQPPRFSTISSPRFSPDGKWIVCSEWSTGGHRDILLMDRDGKKRRKLTNDRALDIEPTFSSDGKQILFASDYDGIYNIYAIDLKSHKRTRLTNELFGAFAPAMSPDGKHLLYVQFGKRGFNLAEVALSTLPKYPISTRPKTWKKVTYHTPQQIYPTQSYNALSTLVPLNWTPVLGTDYLGQTYGLRLSGNDILGFHRYQLGLWYGTDSQEVSYQLSYSYNQLYPSFRLSHGRYTRYARNVLFIDGQETPFPERVTQTTLSMTIPIPIIRNYNSISISYEATHLGSLLERVPLRPAAKPPVIPETGWLSGFTLTYLYSSTQYYTYSFSAEEGRTIWLRFRLLHEALGSIANNWELTMSWAEFIPMPWHHHVIAMRLDGGVGGSSWRARPLFYLGGIPFQDVIQSAISGAQIGSSYLRGYAPYSLYGNAYVLGKIEYRLPMFLLERGIATAPFQISRMHFAFFADVGHAFTGAFDPTQLRVGVGGEFRLEMSVGYYLPLSFRAGFAKGLMQGGVDQLYLAVGAPF